MTVNEGGGKTMCIRQRLYPRTGQSLVMESHLAHARFVFNLGLEQRRIWHPAKSGNFTVTETTQGRELTEARKEFPWLAEGSSDVHRGALRDLHAAYRNFWRDPVRYRAPKFRSRKGRNSFVVKDLVFIRLNRKWAAVRVPKCGKIKFRLTRGWSDVSAAVSGRVMRSGSGKWHLTLMALPKPFERAGTGEAIGIDRGVARTVSTSDGRHSKIPSLSQNGP